MDCYFFNATILAVKKPDNNYWPLLLIIISCLGAASDLLFLVSFVAPLTLSIFIAFLFENQKKYLPFKTIALITVGVVAGIALKSSLTQYSMAYYVHLNYSFIIEQIDGFIYLIHEIYQNAKAISIYVCLFYISILGYTVLYIRSDELLYAEKLLSLTIILSASITTAILIVNGNLAKDVTLARYLITIFWLPVLFCWLPLAKYINTRFKEILIRLVYSFALIAPMTYAKPLDAYQLEYKPLISRCIDQGISEYTRETGLMIKHGIAQYWQARLASEFSDLDLRLAAVQNNLSPFVAASNAVRRIAYDFAVVPHQLVMHIHETTSCLLENESNNLMGNPRKYMNVIIKAFIGQRF